jgi:hypothetical protein
MRFRNRFLKWLLLAAVIVGVGAHACPNCKNALLESGDGPSARMREGYFWSYIVMSSMPFLSLSILAVIVFLHARRKKLSSADGN